ncbi:MAG TPA: UDP-glucose 4-epimerase GalE [Caulobacteraceae bacterium]|nr:UDP-glucose 4-epimerase GalE [Caulobacteraceae bacterium]
MSPRILVTGGAGYVGSHACMALAAAGFTPVVFDDLSNGHAAFVQWGPLEHGDIRDRAAVASVFERHRPAGVLHFAGLIEVGGSVREPARYLDVNVGGSLVVIREAQAAGAPMVFSSTCAIYGEPQRLPLTEDHPRAPLSPYGRSKLMVEEALDELRRWAGYRAIALRYFNAAGGDPEGRIGERHEPETHVLPLAIDAALAERTFTVFGDDYATPDGTAVRDYVHVLDLADAHVLALKRLLEGGEGGAFNLGAGRGVSVADLLAVVRRKTNRRLETKVGPRRAGDPAVLVADNTAAREGLGWRPRFGLEETVEHACLWRRAEAGRAAGG